MCGRGMSFIQTRTTYVVLLVTATKNKTTLTRNEKALGRAFLAATQGVPNTFHVTPSQVAADGLDAPMPPPFVAVYKPVGPQAPPILKSITTNPADVAGMVTSFATRPLSPRSSPPRSPRNTTPRPPNRSPNRSLNRSPNRTNQSNRSPVITQPSPPRSPRPHNYGFNANTLIGNAQRVGKNRTYIPRILQNKYATYKRNNPQNARVHIAYAKAMTTLEDLGVLRFLDEAMDRIDAPVDTPAQRGAWTRQVDRLVEMGEVASKSKRSWGQTFDTLVKLNQYLTFVATALLQILVTVQFLYPENERLQQTINVLQLGVWGALARYLPSWLKTGYEYVFVYAPGAAKIKQKMATQPQNRDVPKNVASAGFTVYNYWQKSRTGAAIGDPEALTLIKFENTVANSVNRALTGASLSTGKSTGTLAFKMRGLTEIVIPWVRGSKEIDDLAGLGNNETMSAIKNSRFFQSLWSLQSKKEDREKMRFVLGSKAAETQLFAGNATNAFTKRQYTDQANALLDFMNKLPS
jgi:hypothetical protein